MFGDNNGDSAYYHKKEMKTACLEDWEAGIDLMSPGSAVLMKRNRAIVGGPGSSSTT
jgi:hypothetical protein